MILLLDTSTPTCKLTLIDGDNQIDDQWEANRELAKGLLGYLKVQLAKQDKTWDDLTGIAVFKGPGSFTGLRIGITVLNTIADAKQIPIIGADGDGWQSVALKRLRNNENDQLVLPVYGRAPNITTPRK